jgi:transglutaminase-like putative cysteine protease
MIRKPTFMGTASNKKLSFCLLLVILLIVGCSSLDKPTKAEKDIGPAILDQDTDGDGLSDFQEIYKYLTDPTKRDSDGDGIPDNDWNERREYTYSVRTILQLMPPFDKAVLNDDFQDARVLEKRDDYIELEVIHYPFAKVYESIEENPNWLQDYSGMAEYLKPGVTTNWDAKMRQDLLSDLKANGIIVERLTDKQVVQQVSNWLMKRSKYLDKVFTTFYIHYPNGQPKVYPGLEDAFENEFNRDKENYDWTVDQHFEHELLGKGMFYNKTHGSCTSFAVYLTTVLRAVGIPTRMVILAPAVDASNSEQVLLVKDRITHNKVREIMLAGLRRSGTGFTNHTINEVYVGNRWCRLNYNKLGQQIFDQAPFGLQTHLRTFGDLSEANLAPTWGWRYAKGERSAVFKYSNPYSAVTISDLFGCHSNIPNPPFTVQDLPSSPLPNIFIMEPLRKQTSDFSIWDEVLPIVKDDTFNRTGRPHKKEYYDNIFNGVFAQKPGDIIVLFFSLDTQERIPEGYEDLLPRPWAEIESDLEQGKTIEVAGKARDLNVILLAAPKREQLQQFIRESEFLRLKKSEQIERRSSLAKETKPSPDSNLPNIYVMSSRNLDFNVFKEIFEILKDATFNKTGRYHEKKSYDEVFIDGVWGKKPGDIVVLLFSFDTKERVPEGYEDLLPRPWAEIEADLRKGKTVELMGKAHDLNIILLAAPKREQLKQLIRESKLLGDLKRGVEQQG